MDQLIKYQSVLYGLTYEEYVKCAVCDLGIKRKP